MNTRKVINRKIIYLAGTVSLFALMLFSFSQTQAQESDESAISTEVSRLAQQHELDSDLVAEMLESGIAPEYIDKEMAVAYQQRQERSAQQIAPADINTQLTSQTYPEREMWAAIERAYLTEEWTLLESLLDQLPEKYTERAQAMRDEMPQKRPSLTPNDNQVPQDEQAMSDKNAADRAVLEAYESQVRERQLTAQRDANEVDPPLGVQRAPNAPTAILTVGNSCTYANLAAAIAAAVDGDEIRMEEGVWTGNANAAININKSLTIKGGYDISCTSIVGETTLDGTGGFIDSVIEVMGSNNSVILQRFNLINGEDDADFGGGLEIEDTNTVTLIETEIYTNTSTFGGGIHMNGGTLNMQSVSRVYNNATTDDGGGIFCDNGGVINILSGSDVGMNGGNAAGTDGTGNGGGLYLDDCTVIIDGDSAYSNDIRDNTAVYGGGIYAANNSFVNLTGSTSTIYSNTAVNNGGGVYLSGGSSIYVDSGTVTYNVAGADGGGIYATGSSTYVDFDNDADCNNAVCASLSNNVANGFSGGGLNIAGTATADIRETHILGNQADDRGSAIYVDSNSGLLMHGSIVADGVDNGNYAIRLWSNATADIYHSTFAYNVAPNGSALFGVDNGTTVTGHGLITWGNDGTLTGEGPGTVTIDNSLLQFTPGAGSGNTIGTDPEFLVDGPFGNYHITGNSPAVDYAGTASHGSIRDIDHEVRPHAMNANYDAGGDEVYARVGRNGNLCSYGSVTDAIAAANPNDTIYIPAGTYNERLGIIDKDLTLVSATDDCTAIDLALPSNSVIIDANDAVTTWGGVVEIRSNASVTFTNMTLEDGTAEFGGILFSESGTTTVLEDVRVRNGNSDTFGGGIRVWGTVELRGDTFVYNNSSTGTGAGGGAAIANTGIMRTYDNAEIGYGGISTGNTSATTGGGVYLEGIYEMYDSSEINWNDATVNGGGIYIIGSSASLTMRDNSEIEFNNTTDDGGGIAIRDGATLLVDGASINTNDAVSGGYNAGGGIFMDNITANAISVTIQNGAEIVYNVSDADGGGISTWWDTGAGEIEINNSTISFNETGSIGGGIRMEAALVTVDVIDSVINYNVATNSGGGIYNGKGQLDVNDTTAVSSISHNEATTSFGGGIFSSSNSSVGINASGGGRQVAIDSNTAGTNGGGLYINSSTSLDIYGHVRVTNNTAANDGGGIYLNGGDHRINDWSTERPLISNNEAIAGDGGGVYMINVDEAGGTVGGNVLEGTDIIENTAANYGGGVYADASNFDMDTVSVISNTISGERGGGVAIENGSTLDIFATLSSPTSIVDEKNVVLASSCNPDNLPADRYCSEFINNSGEWGGGLYVGDGNSTATVKDTAFMNNNAEYGAAIYVINGGGDVTVTNGRFSDNAANIQSAIRSWSVAGTFTLQHSTLADNTGNQAFSSPGTGDTIFNSNIIWGNSSGTSFNGAFGGDGCNIAQGGIGGVDIDPLFTTTSRGDYHLGVGSPAIDACGTAIPNDLDNVARPKGANYDMGAFEAGYLLAVSTDGTSTGTVTSNPAGIDCGTDCDFLFTGMVTLTAVPDAHSTFTGWSGDCNGIGACVVTMSTARTVTATFSLDTHDLTNSVDGTGSGSITSNPIGCGVDCSTSYTHGTIVTLTAVADAHSTFTGWSGDCNGTGVCIVTMSAARTVTATFSLDTHDLTNSVDGTSTGSITSDPIGCGVDCSTSYTHGTVVTLTAVPDAHSTFTGWSGDCNGTGVCIVTMSAARTVTATFSLDTHDLTNSVDGTGTGSITSDPIGCGVDCSTSYTHGTVVTLTAVADAHSTFTGWSGDCNGTGVCIVTMSAARNVTATFETYTIFLPMITK